jgi:hypothetical protein
MIDGILVVWCGGRSWHIWCCILGLSLVIDILSLIEIKSGFGSFKLSIMLTDRSWGFGGWILIKFPLCCFDGNPKLILGLLLCLWVDVWFGWFCGLYLRIDFHWILMNWCWALVEIGIINILRSVTYGLCFEV